MQDFGDPLVAKGPLKNPSVHETMAKSSFLEVSFMDTNCRHRTVVNRRLDPLQHVTPIMKLPKSFPDYSSFVPYSLHYNCWCISKSHLREIVMNKSYKV